MKFMDFSSKFDSLKTISKQHTLIKISIIVYAITFKDVTEVSIRYFECLNYGDKYNTNYRIVSDSHMSCETYKYLSWLFIIVIPILLIYAVVIPIYIINRLRMIFKKD